MVQIEFYIKLCRLLHEDNKVNIFACWTNVMVFFFDIYLSQCFANTSLTCRNYVSGAIDWIVHYSSSPPVTSQAEFYKIETR